MSILKQGEADHGFLPLVPAIQDEESSNLPLGALHLSGVSSSEITGRVPPGTPGSPQKEGYRHHSRPEIVLDDTISIFQCPLRIHSETIISDDTCTEICAILTYNCALAHHLYGVEARRPEYLKQALYLYQTAHGIHLRQERVEESDVSFTLAVLNNVGQLHDLMGNTVASARCFHRMLRILMVLVTRTEECTAETDLFFGNCSGFVLQKPAAPAA